MAFAGRTALLPELRRFDYRQANPSGGRLARRRGRFARICPTRYCHAIPMDWGAANRPSAREGVSGSECGGQLDQKRRIPSRTRSVRRSWATEPADATGCPRARTGPMLQAHSVSGPMPTCACCWPRKFRSRHGCAVWRNIFGGRAPHFQGHRNLTDELIGLLTDCYNFVVLHVVAMQTNDSRKERAKC